MKNIEVKCMNINVKAKKKFDDLVEERYSEKTGLEVYEE